MSYIKKYCDGWDDGYASGLDAAREAVAALLVDEDGWDQHDEWMNDALAAIDALKEKQ